MAKQATHAGTVRYQTIYGRAGDPQEIWIRETAKYWISEDGDRRWKKDGAGPNPSDFLTAKSRAGSYKNYAHLEVRSIRPLTDQDWLVHYDQEIGLYREQLEGIGEQLDELAKRQKTLQQQRDETLSAMTELIAKKSLLK